MEVQQDFEELLVLFNGYHVEYMIIEDFSVADQVVLLGVSPVRIDLVTSITGVSWEQAYVNRVAGQYGRVPVDYIDRAEFILNKRASGRHKDLADIEALGEDAG